MLEKIANDYCAYLNLDVSSEFKTVQDVIDNMLTRLEELSSVLQMIKTKNGECASTVSDDIIKYRTEIIVLSKKVNTLCQVMATTQSNMDLLERKVEKAELDFGVNSDNKIVNFLKPFLKKKESSVLVGSTLASPESLNFKSVINNFHDTI